jgi:histidinol-phosphate aminotransferase
MLAHVDKATTLVYICNPNNPTGTLTPRPALEQFIAKLPAHTYVLVDEAYHHYAGTSADYASFIEHPVHNARVIVTRTFSKVYALAGMRIGYAVAAAPTVAKIMRQQLWAGVNIVGARAASAALKDAAFLQLSVERTLNDRQEFFNEAQGRQLKPLDSHTNFFLMDVGRPAKDVIEHFRRHDILIGREFPEMNTYIRVTLGLPEEMREFWRVWDLLPIINMKM